jgi:drug/metabolite transporter (DMT)-like permease
MPTPPDRRGASDLVLFLLPTCIWGTTWLAIKFQLGVVAPEVSVTWRFGLASVLLLGWCFARGIPLRFPLRDHLAFILLGLLLFGANYVLVYRSEASLTSGLVAVLSSLMVFWNLLGARILFGTAAPRAVLTGAVLGVSGVVLLFWPEVTALRTGGASGQATGIALAVLSSMLASGGTLLSQRLFSRGVAVLPATALGMGWSALTVAAWCAVSGARFAFDARPGYVLSLAYLAAFGSVVAFAAYLTLVGRIGAGRAGYMAVVIPAVAMAVSTVFEGYRWTPGALAGMALVLAGTALVLRARAAAR